MEPERKVLDESIGYVLLAIFGGAAIFLATLGLTRWNVEVWDVRVQVMVAYVLVLTLIVVLRYTWHTARMVEAVKVQAQAAAEQLNFHIEDFRVANKPIIVTDLRANGDYKVGNIGPGLAVNVYQVTPIEATEVPVILRIGALGPDQSITIASRGASNELRAIT